LGPKPHTPQNKKKKPKGFVLDCFCPPPPTNRKKPNTPGWGGPKVGFVLVQSARKKWPGVLWTHHPKITHKTKPPPGPLFFSQKKTTKIPFSFFFSVGGYKKTQSGGGWENHKATQLMCPPQFFFFVTFFFFFCVCPNASFWFLGSAQKFCLVVFCGLGGFFCGVGWSKNPPNQGPPPSNTKHLLFLGFFCFFKNKKKPPPLFLFFLSAYTFSFKTFFFFFPQTQWGGRGLTFYGGPPVKWFLACKHHQNNHTTKKKKTHKTPTGCWFPPPVAKPNQPPTPPTPSPTPNPWKVAKGFGLKQQKSVGVFLLSFKYVFPLLPQNQQNNPTHYCFFFF